MLKPEASDRCACLQDVLKPFLAACGIKSPKLASISLISIQKLLAQGHLDNDDIQAIMQALEQVCLMLFEALKQHCLQQAGLWSGCLRFCSEITG